MINKEGKVDKSWGYELIFSSNDLYCGKLLVFTKKTAKFSLHFHKTKDESWFVNSGRFYTASPTMAVLLKLALLMILKIIIEL